MVQKRRLAMWAFAAAGIVAFVLGASAQEVVRVISQGVVTPADPIWAQDPVVPPSPQEGDNPPDNAAGGRGNQGAGGGNAPPQPRPYNQVITASAKTDDGIFKVHRINDQIFYEIPKKELGKDFLWVNSGQAHRQRRGLRRAGSGESGRALGTLQQPRSSEGGRLQRHRGSLDADRQGRCSCEQSVDHAFLQRGGLQSGRRSRHRSHAALHDRSSGILGPQPGDRQPWL